MNMIYDIIILGGGPAGYTAALYACRAGFSTLVIEKMAAGGQMTLTSDIDNYPGFETGIDGFTLGMKMQQSAERFGAKTEFDEVLSVDFSDKIKKITTYSGEFLAKAVIIATGANPKELGLENEQSLTGRGIHYCAHCDGRFYKDKTVAVIGGGNSAVSDALYLSRIAKKVYLVHRRDTLKATQVYLKPLKDAENIEFLWNSTLCEVIFDNKVTGAKIKSTVTDNINEIEVDGVFISIGRKPATEFLRGILELDNNGYIIADETTKTNIPGIFAVGDVRTKTLRQVVTAVSDGAVAVHFAEEYLSNF
jgi:thioredoxin reductase (NADPH)